MLMANNLTYNNVINAEGNPSHSPSPGHQIELQNAQLCIVRLSFGELFLDILLKISHRVLQHWMRKSREGTKFDQYIMSIIFRVCITHLIEFMMSMIF